MQIRPCAELYADFPDDQIDDEDGEIVQFGGRGVAEAIAAILERLGYDVSPPEHQHEHGWDFEVTSQGKRAWMQVSDLADVFVLATEHRPGFSLFGRDNRPYAEILTRLNAEFGNDVLAEAPGASEPVSD